MPPAVEVCSPNHCNTGESPQESRFLINKYIHLSYFGETDNTEICRKYQVLIATMVKIKQ